MQPTDDNALLRQYAEVHSDEAFAALVTRHVNLVYSVALRHVVNPHNAEEITQTVFIILARKAASLRHEKALSSWLFQVTRLAANNFVRGEIRRHHREQEAQMQTILNESGSEVWPRIAPLLDSAVADLREKDRQAILLRFYEGRNLREIGSVLGASEDAAEKRVNRAVEKLRTFFTKVGVTLSAATIAGAVSANSVQAAPPGLAATITAATLSGTTITTAAVIAATKATAITTLQKTVIAAVFVATVGVGIYEARQAAQLRDEVQTLRQQQAPLVEQIQQLQGERDEGARQLAALREDNERLNRNTGELLRLRGEVGRLRRQSDELRRLPDKNAQHAPQAVTTANNSSAPQPRVAEILVTHPKQPQEVSEEQIRTHISIKVGDIFDRAAVDSDRRNLFSTGLFQDLRILDSTSNKGVVLTYLVQEKPKINKVRFTGNTKFREVDITGILSSKAGASLDEQALFDDAQRIQELYRKSGFSGATVKHTFNVNEDVGEAEVVFEITE